MGIFDFKKSKGFSERIGKGKIGSEIQEDSISDELRTALWNAINIFYLNKDSHEIKYSSYAFLLRKIWIEYFDLPLDTMSEFYSQVYDEIRRRFFTFEWHEVYDFLEYIICIESPADIESFKGTCNNILEKHMSAFRFVGMEITPIINKEEIGEIESSLKNSTNLKLIGVNTHLTNALKNLSDKTSPDYRNSIKESISAVESIVRIITKKDKATLGAGLKIIDEALKIHPALKIAFSKLYGYTSDKGGIRHSILEEEDIFQEDARYFLIACSGFINYLILKVERANLKLFE